MNVVKSSKPYMHRGSNKRLTSSITLAVFLGSQCMKYHMSSLCYCWFIPGRRQLLFQNWLEAELSIFFIMHLNIWSVLPLQSHKERTVTLRRAILWLFRSLLSYLFNCIFKCVLLILLCISLGSALLRKDD